MNNRKKMIKVLGVIAVAVACLFVVFPFIRKVSDKIYKKSCRKEEIDFDNLGLEVVSKKNETEE